ncbi:MAG: L,D-transpeptidase [Beijerinckiaceae bacterium]|nr:L,D-transpeptidase [Beijerinckiaceae bacterium]
MPTCHTHTARAILVSIGILAGSSLSASAQWFQAGPQASRDTRITTASINSPDYFVDEYAAPQRAIRRSTRALVADPTRQSAGTITIDTRTRALFYSLGDGRAIRYGVGVGREGFSWRGRAQVGRKAAWPSWRPPAAMLKRRPDLPRFMDGGIDNPLGARALYLYQGKNDTLFRIHGTNEPWTIGQAVSSGCIRMLNDDVADLYNRVRVGARVVVL